MMSSTARTHNAYTVGWVCALPKEQTAATAMLEERHPNLPKPHNDPNTYTLGSIGTHDIVIACLPKGKIGTVSATSVATHMVHAFPAIRFGLMVGIGGGVPPHVRLGDVVVGVPTDLYPGVVQWDMGKTEQNGVFRRSGALNNPPTLLLTALTRLETDYDMKGTKVPQYMKELGERYPRMAAQYQRSSDLQDILFKANHDHVGGRHQGSAENDEIEEEESEDEADSCRYCDRAQVVNRKSRDFRVHCGLIASGNQVIKDARSRDQLCIDLGGKVLCIEMEAAGLMDGFPCIVIRGICDYADSHKNKAWQKHAAAMAAAFAKELLGYVIADEVREEKPVHAQLENSKFFVLCFLVLLTFELPN
jgi:nucleoside phosphorylase